MKLLIATLTLASAFASASQLPFVRTALLPVRDLDKNHFHGMSVDMATISVDGLNKEVRLHVAIGDTDTMIDLPVIRTIQHPCSRTIVAVRDLRPVDGITEAITIEEQIPAPNVRCFFVELKNPTKVTYATVGYDRLEGKEVRAVSKFRGPHLEYLRPEIDPVQ